MGFSRSYFNLMLHLWFFYINVGKLFKSRSLKFLGTTLLGIIMPCAYTTWEFKSWTSKSNSAALSALRSHAFKSRMGREQLRREGCPWETGKQTPLKHQSYPWMTWYERCADDKADAQYICMCIWHKEEAVPPSRIAVNPLPDACLYVP